MNGFAVLSKGWPRITRINTDYLLYSMFILFRVNQPAGRKVRGNKNCDNEVVKKNGFAVNERGLATK